MVVETKALPTRKSRSKKAAQSADPPAAETTVAAAAGGPVSTDSIDELGILTARLADFGFPVPRPIVDQWPAETQTQITRVVNRWLEEFNAVRSGNPIIVEDRTDVPPLLTSFEVEDDLLKKTAEFRAGEAVAQMTAESDTATLNPYPPGSKLATVWIDAVTAARVKTPLPEAAKPADPNPAPATPAPAQPPKPTAEELRAANAQRQAEAKADRDRQQELAIKAAQHDMEEATKHAADLEDEILDMKAELGELNAAFKNASSRARKASRVLEKARAGVFERTLPFPKESKRDATLEVPDEDIDVKSKAKEAPAAPAPPAPKVDEGAFVSLDHLVKTDLQEFIPGTPEDKGISAKQCEALKKIVGETIGDLEKWMKENGGGEWWRKALKDKGVGLGGAACDKLVEAHEAIRRKFPIPSPDDVADAIMDARIEAVEKVKAEAELPTAEEAAERIVKLCKRAESLSTTCENESGVKFLLDVATEANKRRDTILESGKVTEAQASAIVGWETGIEKWAGDGTAETVSDADEAEVPFGEGVVDDDEEDREPSDDVPEVDELDVPDADEDFEDDEDLEEEDDDE